jgi:hypothetical protein
MPNSDKKHTPQRDPKSSKKNPGKDINVDDAQIEEPKDEVFKKEAPGGHHPTKRPREESVP